MNDDLISEAQEFERYLRDQLKGQWPMKYRVVVVAALELVIRLRAALSRQGKASQPQSGG